MRVFMLGWEFPPFISGGLGTACYGLTKALSQQGTQVTFVLPKAVGQQYTSHVRVLSPEYQAASASGARNGSAASGVGSESRFTDRALANVTFRPVPAKFASPYGGGQAVGGRAAAAEGAVAEADRPIGVLGVGGGHPRVGGMDYGGDLMVESQRYARLCVALAKRESFDVVHAHDWMTFPAGLAVAAATGRPLVVHVHSTEFDRAGDNIHQKIYEIERRGVHGAMRVIAVSHLTRSILIHRYGLAPEKVEVVYNGIDNGRADQLPLPRTAIHRGDKIVLFLGRVTMQKGPEYFIKAAKKVLEKIDNVKFVMAGTGDKIQQVIEMAAAEGIGHKVLFTGFLRGRDVERVFKMADVYVMPSVSEPFGIAPLEAISHDVPVIISKTSGVSEVLTHALKVDFWDTEEIANKIIAVVKYPPLSSTLREHADIEVRKLTWEGAASKCVSVYQHVSALVPQLATV